MKKALRIFVTLILSACSSQPPKNNEIIRGEICPKNTGRVILPAFYRPAEIFIGKSFGQEHDHFIGQVLRSTSSLSYTPDITIVLPNWVPKHTHQFQVISKNRPQVTIKWIQAFSDHTTWVQDYFEPIFNIRNGTVEFIETPYGDDGKKVLENISTNKKTNILPSPEKLPLNENGNFGGNIEAISTETVIVGNNMSPIYKNFLEKTLAQQVVNINTSWLETGHVDEMFTIARSTRLDAECEFVLLYAAPELAIDLIAQAETESSIDYSDIPGSDSIRMDASQCLGQNTPRKKKKFSSRCPELIKANRAYGSIIETELKSILKYVKKEKYCRFKKALPIPVLFAPEKVQSKYGTEADFALAINPNGINGLAVEDLFILPKQPFLVFEKYIRQSLGQHGVRSLFSPSKRLQKLYGGIHCNINVARTCLNKFSQPIAP